MTLTKKPKSPKNPLVGVVVREIIKEENLHNLQLVISRERELIPIVTRELLKGENLETLKKLEEKRILSGTTIVEMVQEKNKIENKNENNKRGKEHQEITEDTYRILLTLAVSVVDNQPKIINFVQS